ncbi:thioredoxin family protein [uncultured Alistipes sp.]|uniref:glutaredoxin family protein n=1 Tax=uncultured Alistipes sp. TaxID=538949 RepID=UPI002601FEB2|nr:thioredoxin family protein [uncultured Alistipes sp.]
MKPVKLFYLKNCPFCRKALRYIDDAKAAHPELAAVGIEMIEESEHPDVADTYDYYYVPTFYVGDEKVHEGGIYPDEVEQVLRKALEA